MAERLVEVKGFEELMRLLDSYGRMSERVFWPLCDAMSQAVQMIEGAAKDRAPVGATGQLRASIGSLVEVNEAAIEGKVGTNLGIRAGAGGVSGYAQAVEYGTKPHWPPLEPLLYWVKRKRLAGTYSLKTRRRRGSARRQAAENLAAARMIQIKISRKGTRAQPFFFPAVEEKVPEMKRLLGEAAAEMVRELGRKR